MVNMKSLLVPFKYSHKVAYVVEFSHLKIRLYAQGTQVLLGGNHDFENFQTGVKTSGIGSVDISFDNLLDEASLQNVGNDEPMVLTSALEEPLVIETPYSYDDLWNEDELCWNVQTIQYGDILYIFHKKYPIMMLKRYSNIDWRLEELPLLNGPFGEVNITETIISCADVNGDENGIVNLVATSAVFDANDEGRLMRFRSPETNMVVWAAEISVTEGEICYSDNKYYEAMNDGTTGATKPVHEVGMKHDGGVNWKYLHDGWGVVKIVEFVSSTTVKAKVLRRLPNTMSEGTAYWQKGLLHKGVPYPISGAFFRNRFAFLLNTETGAKVCFSANGDYNNFSDIELGETTAETAIVVPVLSNEFNEGKWLFAGDVLFVGTGAGEFYIDAVSANVPMASDNVKISQISNVGSKAIMPVAVGAHLFFVDRYGLSLRDLMYNYYNDGYDQTDMSLLGKHLFTSRLVAMSYQEVPDKVLWCLMGDGTLSALTFSAEQEVAAFSRHDFSGKVESIVVIPNLKDCRDELWIEVCRVINGSVVRSVEWLDAGMPVYPLNGKVSSNRFEQERYWRDYTLEKAMYLDGAVVFERGYGDESEVIRGLNHLEGELVSLFADGVVLENQLVIQGQVSIKKTFTRVVVGKAVESQYIPQSIYLGSEASSGIGERQRINHVMLMLYLSGGGKIGQDEKSLCEILYRNVDEKMNTPRALFTGCKEVLFNGATNVLEKSAQILIENDSPLPMNILAIIPSMDS